MESVNKQPLEILLVEDNPGDIRLIKEILKETKIQNNIRIAMDGEAALNLLFNLDDLTTPRPDLILLDLNLPKIDGRELYLKLRMMKISKVYLW